MHVREIPHIIFDDMVADRRIVGTHEFAKANYHDTSGYGRMFAERPDKKLTVGETIEDCWLQLEEVGRHTRLNVYDSLRSIVHDSDSNLDSFGSLVAGDRATGTWAYGGGDEYEQTVWLRMFDKSFPGPEGLALANKSLIVMGAIAVKAHELLTTGPFEASVFFTNEINTDN